MRHTLRCMRFPIQRDCPPATGLDEILAVEAVDELSGRVVGAALSVERDVRRRDGDASVVRPRELRQRVVVLGHDPPVFFEVI